MGGGRERVTKRKKTIGKENEEKKTWLFKDTVVREKHDDRRSIRWMGRGRSHSRGCTEGMCACMRA